MAQPISFGFKLAIWYEEACRHRERLTRVRQESRSASSPVRWVRSRIKGLKWKSTSVPSWGSRRTRSPNNRATGSPRGLCLGVALVAASIEKFATEIRHLQRTEVLEAEEYFSEGQKGSSAMPHKRNPIASENLCGLARVVRGNSLAAMENVALWHERDISHSSVERVIMPDSTILIDYMLARITDVIKHLVVYPANMKRNLDHTGEDWSIHNGCCCGSSRRVRSGRNPMKPSSAMPWPPGRGGGTAKISRQRSLRSETSHGSGDSILF